MEFEVSRLLVKPGSSAATDYSYGRIGLLLLRQFCQTSFFNI